MGLGGFILGGAVGGIGKGMGMQAEQDALERREARLAAARQSERQEDRQWHTDDLKTAEDSTARRDSRLHNQDKEKLGLQFGNQVALADKAASAGREEREDKQQFEERIEKLKLGFEASEKSKQRAWDAQQELGKPIGQDVDQTTGKPILYFRDPGAKSGVRVVPIEGIDARKPVAATGGTSLLTNSGSGAKPAKPAAVPSQNAAYTFNPVTGELVPNKAK
jgi:hypothetical protein